MQSPSREAIIPQLVQNFPASYETRRFISALKSARHHRAQGARFESLCASVPEGLEPKCYFVLSARHLFLNASVQVRDIAKCFVTFEVDFLAPRPTPKLKDHPLLDVCGSLFNIFTANLLIWMPFLPPQSEGAPFCGDRDALTCYL